LSEIPLIDLYADEKNTSVKITRKNEEIINGVLSEGTPETIGTYDVIFFQASSSQGIIADKLRDITDAVAIFDFLTPLKENDILEIVKTGEQYIIINLEDPAFTNEMLIASLKGLDSE